MQTEKSAQAYVFRIEGRVYIEAKEEVPGDMLLVAYAFDRSGRLLGKGDVDVEGGFDVPVKLVKPADVELVIGPDDDPQMVRQSSAYHQTLAAKDWSKGQLRIKPDIYLSRDIWWPWRPVRVCISGHVRKIHSAEDGQTHICPVPYVKVEIFDVDREGCWWPFLYQRVDDLKGRRVLRIPDLIREVIPQPFPEPDPDPFRTALVSSLQGSRRLEKVSINPQPEPPGSVLRAVDQASLTQASRVGETQLLASERASGLENLTLTSKIAPWLIYPLCFYSKKLIGEAYTDCQGYFRSCFRWWPFHFRRGRLRFDRRPDIIIRVTQVINGVPTVIYMDPYTSTRWDVTNAHIDLFLDNEEIVCGNVCVPDPLPGSARAAVLRIGMDPVWDIDQTTGTFTVPNTHFLGPVSNAAYGSTLYIRGNFTADLLTGSPKRYYKLSYARVTTTGATPPDANFLAVKTPLSLLRADPSTTTPFSSYLLGPQPEGSPVAGLYEVQDSAHWWMLPGGGLTTPGEMILAYWQTAAFEVDEGTYILRMEMYDAAGNKINTLEFLNHGGNGSGQDPSPVPVVTGHLDLKVHIDNKPLTFALTTTPAADPHYGVIPWSPALTLDFHVLANQENGRVHNWSLYYTRGMDPSPRPSPMWGNGYTNGAGAVNESVSGAPLLVDPVNPALSLQHTCAFALVLRAWAHIRVNYGFWYQGEKVYALVVEKCPPCPGCPERVA